MATLVQALESRELIGQAQGILMERERITSDDAFHVLRRASQHPQHEASRRRPASRRHRRAPVVASRGASGDTRERFDRRLSITERCLG